MSTRIRPIESYPVIPRRKFLSEGLVVGSALASGFSSQQRAEGHESRAEGRVGVGIAELRLQTNKLDKLQAFYGQDLGLPAQRQADKLTVEAGSTRIVFESVDEGSPFYHVAFNIPENKLNDAVRWQKQRTELVHKGSSEIVQLSKWNAHSVFFRDPAGNLLEYIARHDLKNAAKGKFSMADILYASEIGLVVNDVAETVTSAREELGLGVYRDNGVNFASVGDEHALLVVVKRDRKWFPAREREAKVFPLSATIKTPKANGSLVMSEYGYKVLTN